MEPILLTQSLVCLGNSFRVAFSESSTYSSKMIYRRFVFSLNKMLCLLKGFTSNFGAPCIADGVEDRRKEGSSVSEFSFQPPPRSCGPSVVPARQLLPMQVLQWWWRLLGLKLRGSFAMMTLLASIVVADFFRLFFHLRYEAPVARAIPCIFLYASSIVSRGATTTVFWPQRQQ